MVIGYWFAGELNQLNQPSTINDQTDQNHLNDSNLSSEIHKRERSGFHRDELNRHKGENIMKEKVEAALQKIRPMLQRDGGDVELVDVQEGVVTVRLRGACGGCPMSQMTLKNGIEKILKQEVPGVVAVESAP